MTDPAAVLEPVPELAATGKPQAFKLSPPESRPLIGRYAAVPTAEPGPAAEVTPPLRQPAPHGSVFHIADSSGSEHFEKDEFPSRFELLDEDEDMPAGVSPEVERSLREMAEFEQDPRGYQVVSTHHGFLSRVDHSRPAGWFYVKWRGAVGTLLKLLRFD